MPIQLKDLDGPKGYPIIGNIPKLDLPNLHNQIEEWASEFGDVFKLDLGYTCQTVVTRPSLIQKVLSSRPEEFVRMKKLDRILRDGQVHGVFNAEGDEWELHRKIVAKGLDVKHQQQFYPSMLVSLKRLHAKWERNAINGDIFDIQRDLLRFTVDVTSSLAFGYDMNTIEQEGSAIQDHMENVFPTIFKRINQPIPFYRFYKTKEDRRFDNSVKEMVKLVNQFITNGRKRIEANPAHRENPSNVLEAILVASEEEPSFGDKEVRGNLLTLLMAGEDTTAHTLIWMIHLLTEQPSIQEGIRKEADEVLGTDKWLKDYGSASKLRYIEGAAMESMRFKPVAPVLLFQATKDMVLEDLQLKKGQKILTQYRVGALKNENFTDAKSLNPSRWLKESRCPVHNMDAFSPFGGGPRYCPGRNLAILEIRMVISMLFKNFDVEMVTNHEDIREIMAFTMMSSPYKVKLTKRKN